MENSPRKDNGFNPLGIVAFVATVAITFIALVSLDVGPLDEVEIGPFGDDEQTTREFLAQGDTICREARAEFAQRQQDPPQTAQEAADLAEGLLGISRQELEAIEELGVPDDLSAPLDEYLAAREDGIAIIREGMEAARDGDAEGYAAAQAEVAAGQVDRATLARAVGFSECSKPLTPPSEGPASAG